MVSEHVSDWDAVRACAATSARLAALVLLLASAAGCSLPMEQLSLPTPIGGGGFETGTVPSARGTPLGDPASPGAESKQLYEGSAAFTREGRRPASRAFGTVSGEGVTLDLVDASIPEAAKAVLGDVLGASFTVSEKVKGSVTLQTTKPVSREGLLEIFEGVLASSDAAIVVEAGIYRVVTRDEALAAGKPVAPASRGARPPGYSTEIVPLRFVSATEMERILSSTSPQVTLARVDSARNILVLTGSRSELATARETVDVFDVDWMRGMSFGIFPIGTSDVEAIAQELDTIFANDRDSPSKGIVRFVPNARMKAILVITSRPEYLKKADTWIKRIDLAGEATEKRAFVYQVQYRPVQELAQLLQKVYATRERSQSGEAEGETTLGEGGLAAAADAANLDSPVASVAHRSRAGDSPLAPPPPGAAGQRTQASGTTGLAAAAAPLLPNPEIDPQGALAAAALAAPSGMLAKPVADDRNSGISIVADEGNNALVITATPSEIKRIKQVLAQIDVMPHQVLLEATIAEVSLNDDLKFGLRWFFEKGRNEFRLTDTLAGGALAAVAPSFAGFSYFLNTPDARVVLNALADITNVNVVSSPSLMVLNNKKAVLQIGDEVPVATQSAVSVITPDAPIVNAITFRNTGVILNIIPRVAEDGKILLEIEQEVSDVKPTTSSSIDSPTIQQRRIKTTVSVHDGGTVVLAGMMQDRATRTRQQVPLAGDIPIFGNLFKNKDDVIGRTELLIAITPHVVKDKVQSDMIAAEFRDRLNFTTRPQRATPPDHKEQLDRILR